MTGFANGKSIPVPIMGNMDDVRTAKSYLRSVKIHIASMIQDMEKIESCIMDAEKRFSEDETD